MLVFWRRKAVECACDAPRNAVYEWKSWDGWYVNALLPDVLHLEARPEHDAVDAWRLLPATARRFRFHLDLTDTSRFPAGRRALIEVLEARSIRVGNAKATDAAKRDIRHAFDHKVSPRQVKKRAHGCGCTEFFLRKGERRDELPAALLETAYRFAEGFGLEFGALDIVPDHQGDYFLIDANSTPGMGHAVEDRMAFPREPWERDPQ